MNIDNLNNESSQQTLKGQENEALNGQLPENNEILKERSKKKRNSAITAASVARSAVGHAHAHRISNKPGDFAHSGTNISYEN